MKPIWLQSENGERGLARDRVMSEGRQLKMRAKGNAQKVVGILSRPQGTRGYTPTPFDHGSPKNRLYSYVRTSGEYVKLTRVPFLC